MTDASLAVCGKVALVEGVEGKAVSLAGGTVLEARRSAAGVEFHVIKKWDQSGMVTQLSTALGSCVTMATGLAVILVAGLKVPWPSPGQGGVEPRDEFCVRHTF